MRVEVLLLPPVQVDALLLPPVRVKLLSQRVLLASSVRVQLPERELPMWGLPVRELHGLPGEECGGMCVACVPCVCRVRDSTESCEALALVSCEDARLNEEVRNTSAPNARWNELEALRTMPPRFFSSLCSCTTADLLPFAEGHDPLTPAFPCDLTPAFPCELTIAAFPCMCPCILPSLGATGGFSGL